MTVGRNVLREKLDSILPPGSGLGTLGGKLNSPSTKSKLNNLKAINSLEKSILYPSAGGTGCSVDFDISLLIKLLRNICSLSAPTNGSWDDLPNHGDISLSDDLARVRYFRNKIAHNEEFSLSDSEFDDYWLELSGAFLRLGGSKWKSEIDKLLNDPITEDAKEAKQDLYLWYSRELDINLKFEHQFEKLKEMCYQLETNFGNDEMLQSLQQGYELLFEEVTTLTKNLSSEQQVIQDQYMEEIKYVGDRLHKIERSLDRNRQPDPNKHSPLHIGVILIPVLIGVIVSMCLILKEDNSGPVTFKPVLRSPNGNFVCRDEDVDKIMAMLNYGGKKLVTTKAPYGYGTSEVSVAVGNKLQYSMNVFHIDICDAAETVSGLVIATLGFVPLVESSAQLKSFCSKMQHSLFIFDNIDCILDRTYLKNDFENTLRILSDKKICHDVYIIGATQHSFSILIELGYEYPLSHLNTTCSRMLLEKLHPSLSSSNSEKLVSVSMGVPLVIYLIHDMLRDGQTPANIIQENRNDVFSLERVPGLEERRKIVAIATRYIEHQEEPIRNALYMISFIFTSNFDRSAAKAVIPGSEFTKQYIWSHLNSSSFIMENTIHLTESKDLKRYRIFPFYRKIVMEKFLVTDRMKIYVTKQYTHHFIQSIYNVSRLWWSKFSNKTLKLMRLDLSNYKVLFDRIVDTDAQLLDGSDIRLMADVAVVTTLTKFFPSAALVQFYQIMSKKIEELEKEQLTKEMSSFLSICLAHIYLSDHQHDEANKHLQDYTNYQKTVAVSNPRFELTYCTYQARLYTEIDHLYESAKLLDLAIRTVNDTIGYAGIDLLMPIGETYAEISFLFYTYYHRIEEKRVTLSLDDENIILEAIPKMNEIISICEHIKGIDLPCKYEQPAETVECKTFCKTSDVKICLRHMLEIATESESISLAIFRHILDDHHMKTAFHFDRLAFLLHNQRYYKKSAEYRQISIEVRKKLFGDLHPDVAWSYYGLGCSFEMLEKWEDALRAFKSSLEIRKIHLGDHYLTANTLLKVGETCNKLQNIDDAIIALSSAVAMRKEINDKPESIARALHAYGDLLLSIEDEQFQQDGLKLYKEANRYLWMKTNEQAMKILQLQEDETTGQGSQGWNKQKFAEPDKDKPYYWIHMQVSNKGPILGHGYAPGGQVDSDESSESKTAWV